MTQAWVILTGVDGRDVHGPSVAQLAAALADLYRTADGADGRSSAVLRFGYDDGLMYQVEVDGGGQLRFEEWSDRDCEIALASPRSMAAASENDALQIWLWLSQRQVAKIRSQPWQAGAD